MDDNATIGQTIRGLQDALVEYIEATYHISDRAIIAKRQRLLEQPQNIWQLPFLESTPRYKAGPRFEELGLEDSVADLLGALSAVEPRRLFNPPYQHQADALELSHRQRKNLVVTTGTGSGKTETFLMPVIARLAAEAQHSASFALPGVRALILYPMNALVNDQLGRLRLLFGDERVVSRAQDWGGRPFRFARYTSRTPYPGVRTAKKDSQRLSLVGKYYSGLLEEAAGSGDAADVADRLVSILKTKGRWPAKPDLQAWYGRGRWAANDGSFRRAVTMPGDAELLTRHEVLAAAPDVLVTNYSMLEYMLMRPLERTVFDQTRELLAADDTQQFLLVVDEAHLYRGAAGSEVALLLRRLRARLGLSPERMRVICTSASFADPENARAFAAALTGLDLGTFEAVVGELALPESPGVATEDQTNGLADMDLTEFYAADDNRKAEIAAAALGRSVEAGQDLSVFLFNQLQGFAALQMLVSVTMRRAWQLDELSQEIFPAVDADRAARALSSLVALASHAKPTPSAASLLPCRVHAFFRGLPGLWACLNTECDQSDESLAPIGRLYSQPRDTCSSCGCRVFEFYTCRNCGSAYARAYTDNVSGPKYLWSEPGSTVETSGGGYRELEPIDLCLEAPTRDVDPAELDLVTGRLDPEIEGELRRQVYLPPNRGGSGPSPAPTEDDEDDEPSGPSGLGEFVPCGVCGERAYRRSSVQDHQTKGDQPFQVLVGQQIQVQPPGEQPATDFAPLRGRKVLAFSDSRQVAARLAPNLQAYSMQDALRPLLVWGMSTLDTLGAAPSLDDAYFATLLAAVRMGVRLRPALRSTETFDDPERVKRAIGDGPLSEIGMPLLILMRDIGRAGPPESLLRQLYEVVTDRFYGLESLALGTVVPRADLEESLLSQLPALPGIEAPDERRAFLRAWSSKWTTPGIWFSSTPDSWAGARDRSTGEGGVTSHSGKFKAIKALLPDTASRRVFERDWLPTLLRELCERDGNKWRARATSLGLQLEGDWAYCTRCRHTQPRSALGSRCTFCDRNAVEPIDPNSDPVFDARKGYYRRPTIAALTHGTPPFAIVAAEHTAQLNSADNSDVFSKAEEHELLFQDIDLGGDDGPARRTAIDVLSCTTTMEVGIDIGALSGVAMRNMPPSRSSYQQRSGRAGRRGNAIATVVAFGSADSHDDHYFTEPAEIISGEVVDPVLSLDNFEIARRHVCAYLLQRYLQARLPSISPEDEPQLFEVLGRAGDWVRSDTDLNRDDFAAWLDEHLDGLRRSVNDWLPTQLSAAHRSRLLERLVPDALEAIDEALVGVDIGGERGEADEEEEARDDGATEAEDAGDSLAGSDRFLDRLLYKGALPRYAFPTDVGSFYVFNQQDYAWYRPAFHYSPSQSLQIALTQYAPGKQVWIDGRLWSSGAVYSPMRPERSAAWERRSLYFECRVCQYAKVVSREAAQKGQRGACDACGEADGFRRAKQWFRPPGFAHPIDQRETTSMDDSPPRSYATRAKLVEPGPAVQSDWRDVTDRIRNYHHRPHLLVTNAGPDNEGYDYCALCGRIEAAATHSGLVRGQHRKPFPDEGDQACPSNRTAREVVLGTDFRSDVLLTSLRVSAPVSLRPGVQATQVALRTVAEAMTKAGTSLLELEPNELLAEFRPALGADGPTGLEAEIYLYDTLPGGAGFTRRLAEMGRPIFDRALSILEVCPDNCDRSCYRCLRSFKNRFEHQHLDRWLGASLLRYCLTGTVPVVEAGRERSATYRLFEDLQRQLDADWTVERDVEVDVPDVGIVRAPIALTRGASRTVAAICNPLTPGYLGDPLLRDASEFGVGVRVVPVDELLVTLNLPGASSLVLGETP
jgi:ATP-dependent helicase YprA (DUF1998 family)